MNKRIARELIKTEPITEIKSTQANLRNILDESGFEYDEERREKTLISLSQDIKTLGFVYYVYDTEEGKDYDYAVLAENGLFVIVLNISGENLVYKLI